MEAARCSASLHLLVPVPRAGGRIPLRCSKGCSSGVRHLQQRRRRGLLRATRMPPPRCHKMFVAGPAPWSGLDGVHVFAFVPVGFGEASPEAKAAKNLQHFFTFVAVKVVAAQLQSNNPEAYQELMEFLDGHSLNDGDKFCGSLMRESARHQALALRILEVRSAYLKKDFEWENLKKLAFKMVDESNTRLMRDYILETSHIEDET
ncbi:hypothetical protein Taro_036065 [Colocasia esculenta]|uniref:Chaperonin-like RBCX protein 1, chloroplastic n=1 Tax=Colocasia esculenta TaxID=4460 RepID=A0A843VWB5_COLES|nr:hypothetical protein [Colocasia esculenta]